MKMFFTKLSSLIILLIFSSSYSQSCTVGKNFCKKCNKRTNLCLQCQNNFLIPDEEGGCIGLKKCIVGQNYCEECNESNSICKTCSEGYLPDGNGACTYTPNCEIAYRGNCLQCKNNFVLIGPENGIRICKSLESEDFVGCKEINYLTGLCQQCEEGFYINSGDNKCIEETDFCEESSFGKCISCKEGYYLDHKDGRKCKLTFTEDNKFLHCKETEDGENCSKCEDGYYFDNNSDKKCLKTKFCEVSEDFKCKKCIEKFYLAADLQACSTTENCYTADKDTGECLICLSHYYFDENDGNCKSNREEDDLIYCRYFTDKCLTCEDLYFLGEDNKCSNSSYCAKSEVGVCQKCQRNYYLDKNFQCTNYQHCLYSTPFTCLECDDGYVYNKYSAKCDEITESNKELTNCKLTDIYGRKCSECKDDFYLSGNDTMCYTNTELNKLYKCAKTKIDKEKNEEICISCIKNFYLGTVDGLCSSIKNCAKSTFDEDQKEQLCEQCKENYCLDVKKNICEKNDVIESEEKEIYFKCLKTNKEGNKCQKCVEGFDLESGYCLKLF